MSNGHFTPDIGKESMNCDVCNELMEVERNVYGPTGFAEAMGKRGHLHDRFTCRYAESDWHIQVYKLRQEANKTSSAILAKMLEDEADNIVKTKQATKKVSKYF